MITSRRLECVAPMLALILLGSCAATQKTNSGKIVDVLSVDKCLEAKQTFSTFPFYSASFDNPSQAGNLTNGESHWIIDLDGMKTLIPQASYTNYSFLRTDDISKISFHASSDISISITVSRSPAMIAKAFVGSDGSPHSGYGLPELSIKTMFEYTPDSIFCAQDTLEADQKMIDLMWLKSSVTPFRYPDPQVVILKLDINDKNGFLMRETLTDPNMMMWYSDYTYKGQIVTWAFRYPKSMSEKYESIGYLFVTEMTEGSPDWWPNFLDTFNNLDGYAQGIEHGGELVN